jgi:hypothetical protein
MGLPAFDKQTPYWVYVITFACETDKSDEPFSWTLRVVGEFNALETIIATHEWLIGQAFPEDEDDDECRHSGGTINKATLRSCKPDGKQVQFLPGKVALDQAFRTGALKLSKPAPFIIQPSGSAHEAQPPEGPVGEISDDVEGDESNGDE